MSFECVCGTGLPQFQFGKCKEYIKNVTSIIVAPMSGNDGIKNSLDLTTIPVPESTFISSFNHPNPTKRFHLISGIKNWTPATAESQLQTWDDGTTTKLQNGQISVSFVVPETSPLAMYAYGSLECVNPGVMFIDVANTIVGDADPETIASDKKLYFLPVERWDVTPTFGSATAVAMVTVTIYFKTNFDLSRMRMLKGNQHDLDTAFDYEPQGAVLANGSAATTTTSMQVEVTYSDGGILGNNAPVTGLSEQSFVVTESGTPVPVLTATEGAAGVYVLTFAAQTSADVLIASLSSSSGYVGNTVSTVVP